MTQLIKKNIHLELINKLEGCKTKCKNLHWSSEKMNGHKLLDEFLVIISDYQDAVAEGIMGITGKHLDPNDVKGDPGNFDNVDDFIYDLKKYVIDYYMKIENDPIYVGLKGECESFIHNINKYDYLFSLTH